MKHKGNGMVMDKLERRRQLGKFLRKCRERLSPLAAGLPMTPRRRTPGLRREEVAMLAKISTTYYTKIEQGRVDVSDRALYAIAAALALNYTERNYASALSSGRPIASANALEEQVSPALRLFLDLQNPYPAQVMGRRWDFLAWNEATSATLGDLGAMPPQMRNLMVMLFTLPQMRETIGDWEANARNTLAEFRADYGKYLDDPRFGELVAFLMDKSPSFEAWWTEQYSVGSVAEFEKIIIHPSAGELRTVETVFTVNDNPGQRVLLFLPLDEMTKQKMQQLYEARLAEQGSAQEDCAQEEIDSEPESLREEELVTTVL
jgi:transcriptional regulator with XRE-family HTH domain